MELPPTPPNEPPFYRDADLSLRAMLRDAGVPPQHVEAARRGVLSWLSSWRGHGSVDLTADDLIKRIGYGQ